MRGSPSASARRASPAGPSPAITSGASVRHLAVRLDQQIQALRPVEPARREDEFAGLLAGSPRDRTGAAPPRPRRRAESSLRAAPRCSRSRNSGEPRLPPGRSGPAHGRAPARAVPERRPASSLTLVRDARVGAQRLPAARTGPAARCGRAPAAAADPTAAQRNPAARAGADGRSSGIRVVQAPQRVLQVHDMVVVRHHPRRVLGGDHHVEVVERSSSENCR